LKFLITIEIFCFLFVLTAYNLNGQDNNKKYYQVKGQIRDAESRNIIEFANIGIAGKSIGTVTNKAGRFDFKFNEQYVNDTLYVNAMGYNVFKIALTDALQEKNFTVFLEPQPFNISEITIIEIPTMEIIKRALARIDENHGKNNYVLEGFYREYVSENQNYKRLIESSINVLEQSIKSQFFIPFLDPIKQITQVVEIDEIKTNEDFRDLNTYNWNGIKYLLNENIHGQNAGGVLNTYALSDWKFNNTHTTTLNGEKVFVVEFKSASKTSPRPEGIIYIAMEDYAIVQLDYEVREEMLENWHLTRLSNNSVSKYYTWKTTFSYKRYEGKMFLNYITHNRNFDVINVINGDGMFDIQITAELLINNILKQNGRSSAAKNIANDYNAALLEKRAFNADYWDSFNLPVADEDMLNVYQSIKDNKEALLVTAALPTLSITNILNNKHNKTIELEPLAVNVELNVPAKKEKQQQFSTVENLPQITNKVIEIKPAHVELRKRNENPIVANNDEDMFYVVDQIEKISITQIEISNEMQNIHTNNSEKISEKNAVVLPLKMRKSISLKKDKGATDIRPNQL